VLKNPVTQKSDILDPEVDRLIYKYLFTTKDSIAFTKYCLLHWCSVLGDPRRKGSNNKKGPAFTKYTAAKNRKSYLLKQGLDFATAQVRSSVQSNPNYLDGKVPNFTLLLPVQRDKEDTENSPPSPPSPPDITRKGNSPEKIGPQDSISITRLYNDRLLVYATYQL
jgi:hypothetical protein